MICFLFFSDICCSFSSIDFLFANNTLNFLSIYFLFLFFIFNETCCCINVTMNRRIKYQTEKKKKTTRRADIRRYRTRKVVIDINFESMNELNTNTSISFINTTLFEFTKLTFSVSLSTLIIIEIFQESTNFQEIVVFLMKRRHESRSLTKILSSSSTRFEKFEFATR